MTTNPYGTGPSIFEAGDGSAAAEFNRYAALENLDATVSDAIAAGERAGLSPAEITATVTGALTIRPGYPAKFAAVNAPVSYYREAKYVGDGAVL